ncbi:terminase [Sulfitobacter sp. EhC04]|uniref:phage terminase large subunit n=1 Tax=Sulfitobacter sp. EhC04 TaxID=1849168 RepID=UPI0007F46072|nr:phage terminase large subunit [Sulfitobacter sp. EhC04]OAN76746.1 terminase [Sulfitobacter sp. EhC04]
MGAIRAIRPQPGPQENFLSSPADIAIYGGGAGGGKTWALLLEPLRHTANRGFGAVFFRRSTVQVRNEGGLWDESEKLYSVIGAAPRSHNLQWRFPSGATVSFAHLEYDKTVLDWQGSQIPLIGFDELTHFSEKQFWYMVSRNRSMCGVRPYIRATCNPDADSWVARFIAWWINQDTGLPIPERAGVIRWFVRVGDVISWADHPDELAHHKMPDANGQIIPIPPKSVTFIPAKLTDNAALMEADPSYMASLMSLPTVERERLMGGNWKIRPAAGLYFNRRWVTVVDAAPADIQWVRGWDLASTPKTEGNDPDATSGTKVGKTPDGRYFVGDNTSDHLGPAGVEKLLKNTAIDDGKEVQIDLPQDPGQAGKAQIATLVKLLAGFNVRSSTETGSKITRFNGFSAQAEAGNVFVVRGAWNERWFSSLEGFPEAEHDDDVDSTSRAFNAIVQKKAFHWYVGGDET